MKKELYELILKRLNEKMVEISKELEEETLNKCIEDLVTIEDCDISSTNGLMKFLCKKLPAENKVDMIKSLYYMPVEILDAKETCEAINYLVGVKK